MSSEGYRILDFICQFTLHIQVYTNHSESYGNTIIDSYPQELGGSHFLSGENDQPTKTGVLLIRSMWKDMALGKHCCVPVRRRIMCVKN